MPWLIVFDVLPLRLFVARVTFVAVDFPVELVAEDVSVAVKFVAAVAAAAVVVAVLECTSDAMKSKLVTELTLVSQLVAVVVVAVELNQKKLEVRLLRRMSFSNSRRIPLSRVAE